MASSYLTEQLRQIAGLARAGRLDEAAVMAATVTATAPGDPVLAALAGTVEIHRGQFERAAGYLEIAQRARPDDFTVRTNLAETLYRIGRRVEALALCDDVTLASDADMRLTRLAAHISQETEDFPRAVALYRQVLAREPNDWSLWNNLGNALSGADDHAAAAEALATAVKLAPDAPPIRINLGSALIEAGQWDEAEAVLNEAAAAFPEDAKPHLTLAKLYRLAGEEERTLAALSEAARRAPDDAEILSDHGQEAGRQNEYAIAEVSYEAALKLRPDLVPSIVGLAALYERTNRETELDPLRQRAIDAAADEQTIAFIDALRFKRAERFDEAFAALERAGDAVVSSRRHQLRGIMLDRLGQCDAAFAEFAQMNASAIDGAGRVLERAVSYREHVATDMATCSEQWVRGWHTVEAAFERPAPTFLLGFPRSGTTLLDTMLMAAPDTLILEEERFIPEIEHELGGIEALASLDAQAIVGARTRYFERVAELGELGPATHVIDKHPLHGNKIPVIRRLFPDARFIFAQRHPCDVLLSCFITNFRTNHAMSNFLELETAAELYDLSMSYWTRVRDIFDLPVKTVVYERLVEDTERELRPLFDWLGLPWPEGEFDHRQAARARGVVRTASYAQVTEPVYKRASGRWRRYEKHLAPIFDKLQPWVERFGYSLDDDRIPGWPAASESGE